MSTISPQSATFLLTLLESITLTVGAPDFDGSVAKIQAARDELQQLAANLPPRPGAEVPGAGSG